MKRTLLAVSMAFLAAGPAAARPLASADFFKTRSAGSVAFSPDGTRIAYGVESNDGPGRPYRQLWIVTLADGKSTRLGGDKDRGGTATWSPDGQWIAFEGNAEGKSGLHVVHPDGTGLRFLADTQGTNSPLTFEGRTIAWSPDSKRIAFVSTTPGPETEEASGDPIVITRYLYKPDADEGMTRFNDNRRRHIFLVDAAGGEVRPLTPSTGIYEEHSIDWSPDGAEILYVSSREPDPDLFYNPDLFAVRVADGRSRRISATESAEFQPRWSPDGKSIVFLGTRRGLTDLETTMEDTHVWTMNADGTNRKELGSVIDNRQTAATFSPDGGSVYVVVQERGHSRLMRVPAGGGKPEVVVGEPGRVGAYSVAKNGAVAYTFNGLRDLAQLHVKEAGGSRRLTDLNAEALRGVEIAKVEPISFTSADFKYEIDGFLTRPIGQTAESKHPLIVMIHGGPHGSQGPAFVFKSQFYAGLGWATLQVNYRGSTSYGQKFSDAVYGDQNGMEAMDVLYGVQAAMRRNPWIDRQRIGVEGGSYGGQVSSSWLITQTNLFAAAIPLAAITNNISYNYMTYYNMYEEMEWGMRPHQGNLMDVLWERSALKHVAKAKTPTMMVHGENDNDVPIAEAEQFYIALRDAGVPAIFVRYPREGHGLREPKHQVDLMERSVKWYEKSFTRSQLLAQ